MAVPTPSSVAPSVHQPFPTVCDSSKESGARPPHDARSIVEHGQAPSYPLTHIRIYLDDVALKSTGTEDSIRTRVLDRYSHEWDLSALEPAAPLVRLRLLAPFSREDEAKV